MDLPTRILTGFRPEGDCLVWTRAIQQGYGVTYFEGKRWKTHRLMYTAAKGDIPSGLTLDHLCRNRACGNPDHLEPVTSAVNTMRGNAQGAINAAKTHCIRGHELAGDNLYVYTHKGRQKRACKTCKAKLRSEAWEAEKASRPPREPRTQCHRGHEYAYRRESGAPVCLECQVIWTRDYILRKAAQLSETSSSY